MVIVIWEQWKDSICEQFAKLYNEKILTDVVIQVGKQKCDVHSFVISLFSKFFQGLLEIARNESDAEIPIHLTFTEISFEAIETIISFIYFGEMTVEDDLIPEVLYLARLLQIKGLEDLQAYFSDSVASDVESSSLCIENSKFIYGMDFELDEHQDIHDFLLKKKFEAEVIPISTVIPVNDLKIDTDSEYTEEKDILPCYEEEVDGKKRRRRRKREGTQKKQEKTKKVNAKKTNQHEEEIEGLNTKNMKKRMLEEVEKFVKEGGKGAWVLQGLGIHILHGMSETFCGKLKINKGSELLDDTKNPVKIAKNRMRREMSYFWHQLLTLTKEERRNFVTTLPDKAIKEIFKLVIKEKNVVEILNQAQVNTSEMTCCIIMLLIAGNLPLKMVIESYKVENGSLLYRERIEKAISLYQSTDLFLTDITEQCWVPYTIVKDEIDRGEIMRIDGFDAAIQNALRLCGEGIAVEEVLGMDGIAQYSEDFKRILEHHMGRDIVLPLRAYEERIQLALRAAWEDKSMTMIQAAQEYIVSYSTLCKRALAKEDKDSAFAMKSPSEVKRAKLFYRGTSEPVISSKSTRRGQKSKTDKVIRAALLSCKEGMTPEEAFKRFNINNSRTRNMIKFNVNRKDAPLDQNYTTRFKNAIDEVNIRKKTINEASKLHLINYSALREWFYVKNTNRKIPKASAKNRKKPRFEDQIEAAIHSVRSGMSVQDAFHLHKMKDKKNLNILKYNAEREDAPLDVDYETRLNMAIKAVRSYEMSCTDAGKEYCVNSSTLRYYEHEGFKVPSKGVHNFEVQMKGAIMACRSGLNIAEACAKYNIKTPKYQKILEFNLQRTDPPLDEPYVDRMQKAKDAIFNAEMTISEASDIYMVSPAVLSKHFNKAKKTNTIPKPLDLYDSLSNKFDARMIMAIKCCRQGMKIGKSFKQNRLRSERSLECLKYNVERSDAPLNVPYQDRLDSAVTAVMNAEMKIPMASRHFIVSPFTLEKTCKSIKGAMSSVNALKRKTRMEAPGGSGSITVIPEPDSPDSSLVQVIKQETEDSFEIELMNDSLDSELCTYDNGHQSEKENELSGEDSGEKNIKKEEDDKAIKIQILRRYSKGQTVAENCSTDQQSPRCPNNSSNNSTSPSANKSTLPDSSKKRKYKPWGERKLSIPVTAYQQRLQLALEACMTKKMRKGEAARRFQVNLGELTDAFKEEWQMMFGTPHESP